MDKLEFRKRWISALKSGKYQQGRQFLNYNGKYCCLGVACELLREDGILNSNINLGAVTYNNKKHFPPFEVIDILGIGNSNFICDDRIKDLLYDYDLDIRGDGRMSLIYLNDHGVPFSIIAQIIELEPPGLFDEL